MTELKLILRSKQSVRNRAKQGLTAPTYSISEIGKLPTCVREYGRVVGYLSALIKRYSRLRLGFLLCPASSVILSPPIFSLKKRSMWARWGSFQYQRPHRSLLSSGSRWRRWRVDCPVHWFQARWILHCITNHHASRVALSGFQARVYLYVHVFILIHVY